MEVSRRKAVMPEFSFYQYRIFSPKSIFFVHLNVCLFRSGRSSPQAGHFFSALFRIFGLFLTASPFLFSFPGSFSLLTVAYILLPPLYHLFTLMSIGLSPEKDPIPVALREQACLTAPFSRVIVFSVKWKNTECALYWRNV